MNIKHIWARGAASTNDREGSEPQKQDTESGVASWRDYTHHEPRIAAETKAVNGERQDGEIEKDESGR